MSTLKNPLEALYQIEKAIEHTGNALSELDRAAQQLSSIIGIIPVWKKTCRLYDQVRDLMDQLDGLRYRTKPWELDEYAMKVLDKNPIGEGHAQKQ